MQAITLHCVDPASRVRPADRRALVESGSAGYHAFMTLRTTYLVQTFEIHRKRLVPTLRTVAKTATQAERMAESTAERKSGAAAIEVSADDETGEVNTIRILASFGEVPEDFAELIQNA